MITKQVTIMGCDVVCKVELHRDVFGNFSNEVEDIIITTVNYDTPPVWVEEIMNEYHDDTSKGWEEVNVQLYDKLFEMADNGELLDS